jgi:hypothetical protein
MDLFIRHPNDLPHAQDGDTNMSKCDIWLAGANKISEVQALVYLKDARCSRCFPGWTTGGRGVRHG